MVELKDYLLYLNGKKVEFFALISDAVEIDNRIIVCTSSRDNNGKEVKDNIFAINRKGEILWQVETPFQHWLNKKVPQIYYNINYQNDKLTAQNGGSLFFIDTENGKIVDRIDDYGREKP
jgi:hypothetical protein